MVEKISANSATYCVVAGAAPPVRPAAGRRRALLKAGASWRALLAVQAAMSVGIVLARPAHAATPIAPTGGGYSLGNPANNPFYLNSGTLVSNGGFAIYGNDSNWTITNNGTVGSSGATGIYLKGTGFVSNGGSVTGGQDGIFMNNGPGSVANDGYIHGSAYNGVELHRGGSIANFDGGIISGGYAGVKVGYRLENQLNSGIVHNSGTIMGNTVAGVIMYGGGFVDNDGVIIDTASHGRGVAMYAPESTVSNWGLIRAGRYGQGVRLQNGGYVDNRGTISAGSSGEGVYLRDGGYVANRGFIYGGFGVQAGAMSAATVQSTGLIEGATIGVQLAGGGYVNNEFRVHCDNFYIGTIIGGQVGVQVGDGGSVNNYGYIRGGLVAETYGIGVQLTHGGIVYNDSSYTNDLSMLSGTIVGGDTGVQIAGASGYVYNTGTIGGGKIGVALLDGGSVNNTYASYYNGCWNFQAYGTIIGGQIGVLGGSLAPVAVTNYGLIEGFATAGIDLLDGGSVYNAQSGVIAGGEAGVALINAPGTVTNAGQIFGFAGVYLKAGGSLLNTGEITGYFGVLTGPYVNPNDFEGTAGVAARVVNYGSIGGFAVGVGMDGGGYLSNASSGVIISSEWGVLVGVPTLGSSTIFNAGVILGQSIGIGALNFGQMDVYNQSGGSIGGGLAGIGIGNVASVYIYNSQGGTIGGVFDGVVTENYGSLANAIVTNAGSISAWGDAVLMSGGSYTGIFNLAGGTLTGEEGNGVVVVRSSSSYGFTAINNAGSIFGANDGVSIVGGAYLSIANVYGGTIIGGHDGIYVDNVDPGVVAISNAGSIYGGNIGINVVGGTFASVANLVHGTISGFSDGVEMDAVDDSIGNAGLITASADNSAGVYEDGTGDGEIVNEAGGTIEGIAYGAGFDVDGTAYLDNSGTIAATGSGDEQDYMGVYLEASTALVDNNTNAVIAGYYDGVVGDAYVFSMTNAGTILSDGDGVTSDAQLVELDNSGTILSGYQGVYLADETLASVFNQAGGTIMGYQCAVGFNGGSNTLVNAGLVEGYHWKGVEAYGTYLQVTNLQSGTIGGKHDGIYSVADQFSLDNAGLIFNTDTQDYESAVKVKGSLGSDIVNRQTGTLTGNYSGVYVGYGSAASLINAGLISGTYAVILLDGQNSLVNTATGTIAGSGDGAFLEYGAQAYNAGVIIGTSLTGVALFDGGELQNAAGGTIAGGQYGVYSGYTLAGSLVVGGTVFNAGLITGGSIGVQLINGGAVSNFAGGVIDGGAYGVAVGYAGSTVANTGNVYNAGTITGGVDAITLTNGGEVVNAASGVITGGVTGIDLPENGTVLNAGTITGTTGAGVAMLGGGSLTNSETGLIQGGTDGVIAANGSTIVNAGRILDEPAFGHAGVVLEGASSLTNLTSGTISGEVGVLVSGNDATIVDAGAIISTDGGDAIQIQPQVDPAQITLTTGASLTGAIDGGGTAGQITLTGQNTLNDTISNFGAGSALTIAPGATWAGAGNWTIANVNNTGTFQGGLLNAPLNLTGNFTSTGTLQVIVTPTISTQINVSGTATLSGGLTYIFAPGLYTPGKTYNFVVAAGGASGDITDVTYVGATPYYVSKTTNLLISGNTLGSDLVLGRVAPLDDSVFADENQNQAMLAQAANDELLGKASGDSGANAAACAAAEKVMPGETSPRGTSLASQMTGAVANAFCGAGGWIEATGSTMTIDNSGGATGYAANDAGFLAGLDRDVTSSDTKLGLAVGYDDAWLNDKGGGKATSDTFRVGLYAAQPVGMFTIEGDIMYGHANNTTTRATGIGAVGASFGSNVYNGGAQVNTNLLLNGVAVTPAAGVKFASANAGGFSETSSTLLAPFEVSGGNSSYTSVQPYVNLGLSKIFTTESQIAITPQATVGYTLEAGDRGKAVTVNTQDGTAFATGHTSLDTGAAQIEAGISAGKNNWALYAKYAALLSGNYTAQAGEAGLQIKF
jgi:hypothetical protein